MIDEVRCPQSSRETIMPSEPINYWYAESKMSVTWGSYSGARHHDILRLTALGPCSVGYDAACLMQKEFVQFLSYEWWVPLRTY